MGYRVPFHIDVRSRKLAQCLVQVGSRSPTFNQYLPRCVIVAEQPKKNHIFPCAQCLQLWAYMHIKVFQFEVAEQIRNPTHLRSQVEISSALKFFLVIAVVRVQSVRSHLSNGHTVNGLPPPCFFPYPDIFLTIAISDEQAKSPSRLKNSLGNDEISIVIHSSVECKECVYKSQF